MNFQQDMPPVSPSSDSDYFSEGESSVVEDSGSVMDLDDTYAEDWIELDFSAESALTVGFLTDADFHHVLTSLSEFTSQHLQTANNCSPRELLGLLRNHLAYLLWRRAVEIKLRYLPPIHVEVEELDRHLDVKWREESDLMNQNRARFFSLADATTVPRLVLSTIRSYCRKRPAQDPATSDPPHKRARHF